jgi:mannose/cellobiose epimerase-like protein (N-acyl-D-glucosamine 2-epimerase family)
VNGDAGLLRPGGQDERVREGAPRRRALHGGVFDAHPVAAREKRQNPLMHLLEAYLALERAAPGCGYLEDAAG